MDIYEYTYSDDIGKFVLITYIEDDKVLIYSATTKTFPRFKIILGNIFEQCEIINSDIIISRDDLIAELLAFKFIINQDVLRQKHSGCQKLLEICEKYLFTNDSRFRYNNASYKFTFC